MNDISLAMKDTSEKARVCAWRFNLQLRSDSSEQKDVSDCLRKIMHDAPTKDKIHLDMVSFAWSPDANEPLVEILGFIRAHGQVRKGTLKRWMQDDQVPNQVT